MAQINLLKQSSTAPNLWVIVPKILVRLLLVVLVGILGYYGWLYFASKSVDKTILNTQNQIRADQQAALSVPGRDEVLTRQAQIKAFDDLVSQHVYWSQLFPRLAKSTFNKATYLSLKVGGADGVVTLNVNVNSLEDLDRYLQVFDLPEVSKYFNNVRVGAYHKIQGKGMTSYGFEVNMNYNSSIIQYIDPKSVKK